MDRRFALHFHPARAAHHHQLFVGRMKVPGRATALRALDQQDRRPARGVPPLHRQREAVGETRILLELTGCGVLREGFVALLSDRGRGYQGEQYDPAWNPHDILLVGVSALDGIKRRGGWMVTRRAVCCNRGYPSLSRARK